MQLPISNLCLKKKERVWYTLSTWKSVANFTLHKIFTGFKKKTIKLMKHDFVYFRLSSLQHLSVANNQLIELPVEMCALIRLEEFHVAGNQLTSLPLEFGFLVNLEKLYLQKNKIRELPEVFEYLFLFILINLTVQNYSFMLTTFTNYLLYKYLKSVTLHKLKTMYIVIDIAVCKEIVSK
jgi:hypothetical protein